jgi:hypothetical protein
MERQLGFSSGSIGVSIARDGHGGLSPLKSGGSALGSE